MQSVGASDIVSYVQFTAKVRKRHVKGWNGPHLEFFKKEPNNTWTKVLHTSTAAFGVTKPVWTNVGFEAPNDKNAVYLVRTFDCIPGNAPVLLGDCEFPIKSLMSKHKLKLKGGDYWVKLTQVALVNHPRTVPEPATLTDAAAAQSIAPLPPPPAYDDVLADHDFDAFKPIKHA
ncbi:Uncharacterized protein PBTT_03985 [Plasmodiophora brassicae]|uniref:Uncharacterized protein n=1 Tax=Plasmodiophora brassicae TaxID=37360 RepID=A0A3P3Y9X7_PLABS|nr:unnamed protein product [Plasmodiophora brassicae]